VKGQVHEPTALSRGIVGQFAKNLARILNTARSIRAFNLYPYEQIKIQKSLLSMTLIQNVFAYVIRITFCVSSVCQNYSSDYFGRANSFNASGKNVLVTFFRQFSENRDK
jgi:hypothetical protein